MKWYCTTRTPYERLFTRSIWCGANSVCTRCLKYRIAKFTNGFPNTLHFRNWKNLIWNVSKLLNQSLSDKFWNETLILKHQNILAVVALNSACRRGPSACIVVHIAIQLKIRQNTFYLPMVPQYIRLLMFKEFQLIYVEATKPEFDLGFPESNSVSSISWSLRRRLLFC